jgi:hypothetical protein
LTTALAHANGTQAEATLQSPSGKVATITKQRGGGGANVFNGTLWDDKADPGSPIPYGTTNPNLVTDHAYTSGVLATPLVVEEALSAFDGDDPNGTWTLTIRDTTAGSTGTLDGWSLEVATITCAGATCPVDCDDNDPCTTDSCDPQLGCVRTPVACDDGNACTADSCDPQTGGCIHTTTPGAACSDGDVCTVGDTCDAQGACVPTGALACSDGDVCTADSCAAASGCVHTFLDGDGDGVCDPNDCAPQNSGAFAVPPEVKGDSFSADKQIYGWTSVAALAGSGTRYGVLRGQLSQFPVGSGAAETCLGSGIAGTSTPDATVPAAGVGFYYLVHGHNVCGIGTYGSRTGGPERTTPVVCP